MRNKLEKYTVVLKMLFLLSIFGNHNLFAQESCGFNSPTQADNDLFHQTIDVLSQDDVDDAVAETQYIPIQAHIVRNDNGTGGLTPSELQAAIEVVNQQYSSVNMEFIQCSDINYIDDSNIYDLSINSDPNNSSVQINQEEILFASNNDVENVINIYFFNSVTKVKPDNSTSNLCGYAYFPGGSNIDRAIMKNSCAKNGSTLAHELGHYFGLLHTHGSNSSSTFNCNLTDELVDQSNCATTGDEICDTPADPNLSNSNNFCGPGTLDENNCTYTGNFTDNNGQFYQPLTNNIMSYAAKACRTTFTNGQLQRAVCTAITARSYLDINTCPNAPSNPEPPVVSCPNELDITNDIAGGEEYEAANHLTASNTIYSGAVVSYDAGISITLEDGFLAQNGSDFLAFINGCNEIEYCTPAALGELYIKNFNLQSSSQTVGQFLIDNYTHPYDYNSNGYTDYTTTILAADVNFNDTYYVNLERDFESGINIPIDWRVWIDFNQNGDFNDPGELVIEQYSDFNPSGSGMLNGSFMVPTNTLTGQTRMRVGVFWEGNAEPPCSDFNYGEFEDYRLNIDPNSMRLANDIEEPLEMVSHITAFPNPMSDLATITYTLQEEIQVNISIFSMEGKLITTLVNDERQNAGSHHVQFKANDLPNGTYFYRIHTGYQVYTDRLTIVK